VLSSRSSPRSPRDGRVDGIDPARFLHEHLAQASPDLLRSLLTTVIDTLMMSVEADAVCGAGHGERSHFRWAAIRHRGCPSRAPR
jgi:hypothetical protein